MIRLLGPTSRLLRWTESARAAADWGALAGRPESAAPSCATFGGVRRRPELRQGQELHHPVPLGRGFASRHVRPEARRAGRDPRRVRHDRHRDCRAFGSRSICPKTAKLMDRIALVRSMTHTSSGHATGGYTMFTGQTYAKTESEANFMGRQEAPHIGSALAKIAPGSGPMFPFILVPRRLDAGSGRRAGQWGGSLGSKYDPMQTGGDPNRDDFRLENLPLLANAPRPVLQRRLGLVDQLNRADALPQGDRAGPRAETEPGEGARRHRLGGGPAGGRPLHGRPRPSRALRPEPLRAVGPAGAPAARRRCPAGPGQLAPDPGGQGLRLGQSPRELRGPARRPDPPVRSGVRRPDRPTWNRAASSTRPSWSSRPSSAARPR